MTRLILVRHGESLWNAERRLQGDTEVELSERGRRQAAGLAPLVRAFGCEAVVTSDLSRTVETARLLGFPDARRDPRWREIVVGEWAGERIAELLGRDEEAFRGWRAGTYTPPGGETWEEFAGRTERALAAVLDPARSSVLVVTHGGCIRATVARLLGIGPGSLLPVEPASATVLELGGVPRLAAYNVTPWGAAADGAAPAGGVAPD